MLIYQKKILDNLYEIIEKEEENILKAKDLIIEATKNKNSIYVFGASHAGIISQELFYRAGGLITVNPIFTSDTMVNTSPITRTSKIEQLEGYGKIIFETTDFKPNDVLLLHSVSGRNPIIIDLALKAKEMDIKTIAITNISYSKDVKSRHSSGKNLYEIADIIIDNHGVKGDAAVEIGNINVGPTSTITSVFIANTIITEVAVELDSLNIENMPFFYSANLDNTAEKNKELVNYYKDVIHYKF
ncbi:MAG: SIS domain-containing protein [Peptoniphilaceae bacterium]|nr:SIS domain-containing protein [Peptoniphilaceae bacterium]MDY6018976.1 SIS domain-containing protein [Anaerococcus sp.]